MGDTHHPPPFRYRLTLVAMLPVLLLAQMLVADHARAVETEAAHWLDRYQQLIDSAPAECAPAALPRLPEGMPARAFPLDGLAGMETETPRVVYSPDNIMERLIVLAQDARGCVHVGQSGRAVAFHARSIDSPFPNTQLPRHLGAAAPVAIIADHKSIRPWVQVAPAPAFRADSARAWVGLGAYTGILVVLLLVGIGFMAWQRRGIATAYVVYICALQLYQLQAFGLGFAWVPFWPGPEHARLMQALAVAVIVPGITGVVLAFLRPKGMVLRVIIAGVALSTLGFLASAWTTDGYRFGAAVLAGLALLVLWLLARRLRQAHRKPWIRWFAAGLGASMLGGGTQALSIVAPDAGLPQATSSAFLLGTLVESICWAVAMALFYRTERQRMQRRLEHDATHDSLTKLHNRAFITRRLEAQLARLRRRQLSHFALLSVDIDGFKQVNDGFGHRLGDELLRAIARALEAMALPVDTVARYGGDEFLLLMRPNLHKSALEAAASSIIARFEEPFDVGGRSIPVTVSVGVLPVTDDAADADTLVQQADTALYAAKDDGGGRWVLFEPHMRRTAEDRAQMRVELHGALAQTDLELHYQPLFSLDNGRPMGFEALLRWQHPRRGLLPAAEFLPVAEHCGLMREISAEVLEMALQQLWRWQQSGVWRHGQYLSLNLSRQQLIDERLLEQLDRAFERYPVDPGSIRLDIPEAALAQDAAAVRNAVARLLGRNLLLSIDDFGCGPSPLTMLAELTPDMIKLDGSVVEGIAHRERCQNLARMAQRLGEELGCLVSAEGVERFEQLAALQALGYGYGQGQLLAPPMPADRLPRWLRQNQPQNLGFGMLGSMPPMLH